MSSAARRWALGGAVALVALACAKVPYTNRSQFNVIPKGTMHNLGEKSYQEILAESKVIKSGRDADLLDKVGRKIARVADQSDFAWQFSLIADKEINAWCLPGGYIGFFTGILPVLESEAGMAFVMGHEVGHAVARHGAERLSQQLAATGGLSLIEMFLSGSGKVTQEQKGIIMAAAGLGAQYGVMLPFSRNHEKEADIIGVMYMAEVGYPPAESLKMWDRMEATTGKGPPAFLSTHPSNQARKENLQEWLPEAKKRYQRHALDYDTRATLWQTSAAAD